MSRLAKRGASVRLDELVAEAAEIHRAFPELRTMSSRGGTQPKRRRRTFTDAEKEAISKRMKAYWAKRRQNG
jgi:hypothetical protein